MRSRRGLRPRTGPRDQPCGPPVQPYARATASAPATGLTGLNTRPVRSLCTLRSPRSPGIHATLGSGCLPGSTGRSPAKGPDTGFTCSRHMVPPVQASWRNALPGGPGRLPSPGSHRSGHAQFAHPALQDTGSPLQRWVEWTAIAGGRGKTSSSRLNRSHVISAFLERRPRAQNQARTSQCLKLLSACEFPVIP